MAQAAVPPAWTPSRWGPSARAAVPGMSSPFTGRGRGRGGLLGLLDRGGRRGPCRPRARPRCRHRALPRRSGRQAPVIGNLRGWSRSVRPSNPVLLLGSAPGLGEAKRPPEILSNPASPHPATTRENHGCASGSAPALGPPMRFVSRGRTSPRLGPGRVVLLGCTSVGGLVAFLWLAEHTSTPPLASAVVIMAAVGTLLIGPWAHLAARRLQGDAAARRILRRVVLVVGLLTTLGGLLATIFTAGGGTESSNDAAVQVARFAFIIAGVLALIGVVLVP